MELPINKIIQGDALEEMKKLPENLVDAIITDPPYGLEFMGKEWDKFSNGELSNLWQQAGKPSMEKFEGRNDIYSKPKPRYISNKKRFGIKGQEGENDLKVKKNFEILPRFFNSDMVSFQEFTTNWAKECLRVLKPGGYLLSFGGTRTYHRMTCGIEDARFEIRDCIGWVFGSGFPKSLNISKNMEKQIDNFIKNVDYDLIWKNQKITSVFNVEKQSQKNQIEVESNIEKRNSVLKNVLENIQKEEELSNVKIVENLSSEVNLTSKNTYIVLQNVREKNVTSGQNVKFVVKKLLNEEVKLNNQNIFIVECSVKELLRGKIIDKIRGECLQKIWLGKLLSLNKQDSNVLYVEMIENWKPIILNQLKIFQNLDMKYLMDNVSATNVIITKSIMECLTSFMVNILKEETKIYEGEGTALKPAWESICVARKPLSEKNVALNVLKWGTGGINIDESRIQGSNLDIPRGGYGNEKIGFANQSENLIRNVEWKENTQGRFPANIIFECICDELKEGKPEKLIEIKHEADKGVVGFAGNKPKITKGYVGGKGNIHTNPECPCYMLDEQGGTIIRQDLRDNSLGGFQTEYVGGESKSQSFKRTPDFGGGASRFFYVAKASKSERNFGLENTNIPEKSIPINEPHNSKDLEERYKMTSKNFHPTVKPIKLMEYLIKLVTREGAIVLDPFIGSGTTAIACLRTNRKFIGIEKEEEYCKIANARIKPFLEQQKL